MIPAKNPIPVLIDFIKAWVPDLGPEHRVSPNDIPSFVPLPLRILYEETGSYPIPFHQQWRKPNWSIGLFGMQDQLLPPDQLVLTGDKFQFLHENQNVWNCETFADQLDPPVHSDSLSSEYEDTAFREVCHSLSHFLVTYCLQELVFRSNFLFCVDSRVDHAQDLIEVQLDEVWLNGFYVYGEPSHSFYSSHDRLIVMHSDGYWIACNDEHQLRTIHRKHQIRRIR